MVPRADRIPLRPDYSAARGRAGDLFVRGVAAALSAKAHGEFVEDSIRRHWDKDRHAEIDLVTRAATSPGTISGSGWLDSFAMTALGDFLLNIGGVSAGSAVLARCLNLQFNGAAAIRVPSITTSATGVGFVSEASPIPVRQYSIAAGVTLSPRVLATISVFNREIFEHSTPSIESLVRAVLAEDIGLQLDTCLFDATAGDTTRPGGLLNGISATTPTAAGDWAMLGDIEALSAAVAPVAGNSSILFVASPKQARRMQYSAQIKNIEGIYASSALADKTVIAIASNCLVSALDPAPRFEVRDGGLLVMRDDPVAFGTVASPNTVGAPAISPWQTDRIGLKVRMEVSWALRSSTGLAYMSAVNW
jgi:hypothetical protein